MTFMFMKYASKTGAGGVMIKTMQNNKKKVASEQV